MSSLLTVSGLTAGYGRLVAVHDVSFTANAGEITTVFGHNGAGKSTVMKSIAGVLPGAHGELVINGVERPMSGSRGGRGLAMVPQGSSVFPRLTVEENVRLGFASAGRLDRDEITRRLDSARGYLPALVPKWKSKAGDLSGGQRQMVSIARALVAAAPLLLLDEPSLGLAPKLVEDMMDVFSTLKSTGIAIVLVEQNVKQALRIADRSVVMRSGSVILDTTADELLARESFWDLF
jgi:branched-chain amino acid transport system ATP-binding protein